MKIGLFTDTYHPSINGIVYVIDIIYENLAKQGHEITIVAPRPGLRVKNNLKIPKKEIVWIPAIEGLFFDDYLLSVFSPSKTVNKLKKYEFELIIFFTPAQVGLLGAYIAKRSGIPLIEQYCTDLVEYVKMYPSVVPGVLALSTSGPFLLKMDIKEVLVGLKRIVRSPHKNLTWHQKTISGLLTSLHNSCDLIISVSTKSTKQLKIHGVKTNIVTIPTGVDSLTTDSAKIKKFKRKFDLNDSDKIILYVGRMGEEKNLDMLLDAYDIVAKKIKNTKLLFTGDFTYRKKLEEIAAKSAFNKQIIFTGRIKRTELGNVYKAANVFAFPSITDTQALVLNEAAHAGLPIVWCDKYVNEVVEDGSNGLLANPNAKSFASAIIKIIGQKKLAAKYSKESSKRAKFFSEQNMTKKLAKKLDEITKKY